MILGANGNELAPLFVSYGSYIKDIDGDKIYEVMRYKGVRSATSPGKYLCDVYKYDFQTKSYFFWKVIEETDDYTGKVLSPQ